MSEQRDRVDHIVDEWHRERPDLDVTPMTVIGRLHRLADRLQRELDANFRAFGLSSGEFDVLAALRRAGDPYARSAGELADSTMITAGGLTKRVDRLEQRGLVIRTTDPGDARGRSIRLTPEGLSLIDEAFTAHIALENTLLGGLATDAATAAALLRTWGLALDGR